MAQVAINADLYAEPRQNIFFKTIYPSLEGQCVTLVKCFMEDMTEVPNPHAARGDARYVGKTLVAQGHAIEVPYAERRRGDIICYEYGVYGHISVQLSGGKVFEQNVNLDGVRSKIVDGQRVYASRIGSENEAWRKDKNPHIYRLKTYKEISPMSTVGKIELDMLSRAFFGYPADAEFFKAWEGTETNTMIRWCDANPAHKAYLDQIKQWQEGSNGEYVETKVYVKKEG